MSSLASKAKSSVIWNTGFNLFRDILQFLVMIVLVRMISPESYGQFALVTSIIGFIHVFSFSTFIQHVLQVRDDSKVNYQLHFTFGFFLQVFMFVLTNLIALIMSYFSFYDSITIYIHIMSIVFFLELFSEIQRIEYQRNLDWKRMRILHAIGLILGAILAIFMANLGAGIYALIIPSFMSNIPFIYEMFIKNKWRPTWEWNYLHYKNTISFSKKRIISGLMVTGKPFLENSFFVTTLGYTQLGFYNRAIGLATLLVNKLALQLTFAIYPILTKIDPFTDAFRRISGLIIMFVFWFIIPILFIVYNLSNELVTILYGEKWLKVIDYLSLAAIVLSLSAVNHVLYSLLLSSHKVKLCTFYDVYIFLGTILILLAVLSDGIERYLHFQIILFFSALIFLLFVNVYFKVLTLKSIITALLPSVICSFLSLFITNFIFEQNSYFDSSFFKLFIYSIVFSILYVTSLRLFFSISLGILVNYLPMKSILIKILFLKEEVKNK